MYDLKFTKKHLHILGFGIFYMGVYSLFLENLNSFFLLSGTGVFLFLDMVYFTSHYELNKNKTRYFVLYFGPCLIWLLFKQNILSDRLSISITSVAFLVWNYIVVNLKEKWLLIRPISMTIRGDDLQEKWGKDNDFQSYDIYLCIWLKSRCTH